MPRNGSGTASVVNSFTPSTLISASQMNANFVDMASMMTASLPRDGQAAMTGQMKGASGTVSLPGITFSADPSCGDYRIGSANIGRAISGVLVQEWDANGINVPIGKTIRHGGTRIVPTGVIWDFTGATAPTGWVMSNGLTIGSVSSGGTGRANADTSDLFSHLWTEFTNTELVIQDSAGTPTTRGANAAADFAANKRMPLPDFRGRVAAGLDAMGQVGAARLSTVIASSSTMGVTGGAQTHTLASSEMPSHSHTVTDPGHTHTWTQGGGIFAVTGGGTGVGGGAGTQTTGISGSNASNTTGITNQNTGGGGAHANVQPTFVLSKIIKL